MKKRSALLAGLAVLAVGLFALRGVFLDFHLEGPPGKSTETVRTAVEASVVMAPIVVDLGQAGRLVNAALNTDVPVASGTTEQLALNTIRGMFGLELLEKVECQPTEAAKLAERALECMGGEAFLDLNFGEKLLKSLECGFKGGIDAALTAFRVADECVDVHVPLPIPDRPTEVAYDLYLDRLEFAAEGRLMKATAHVRVAVNPPSSVFSVFVKKPRVTCSVRITGVARVTPGVAVIDGAPLLNVDVGQVALGPGKPCDGSTPAQVRHILDALDELLLKAMAELFQTSLIETIEETLNTAEFAENFAVLRNTLEGNLFAAHEVPLNGVPVSAMVRIAPKGIRLSQPHVVGGNGKGAALVIGAGVVAQPEVALTPLGDLKQKTLPYSVQPYENAFRVTPTAELPLDEITPVVVGIGKDVIAEALPNLRYDDLDLTFYQAGDQIVIGAELTGVTWLRLSGTVFLTMRPDFNRAANRLALRDVKFDLDSTQFLTRWAAWVLESPVEALLSEQLSFDLGEPFRKLLEELHDMELFFPTDAPVAKAQIWTSDLALDQTWLSNNSLFVSVAAAGTALISID